MNKVFFPLFAVALATCLSTNVSPAQNFFWSPLGLGDGAVEGDLVVNPEIGESTTLFLYYSPGSDIREGFVFDFSWETTGVAAFNNAEVFDFDITVLDTPFSQRWGDAAGVNEVSDDAITGLIGKTVTSGTGLLLSQIPGEGIFVDTGYDTSSNSFLIASIEFLRIGPGVTTLQIDENLAVNGGLDITATFSGLQVGLVPEPSAVGVLSLGILFAMRRRQI